MLSRDQSADKLVAQTRYAVVLEVDGRFSSVSLTPEKKAS
jgi:hypothetical protein